MIGAFKSLTTNKFIENVKMNNWKPFVGKLWQRNYYEHIIRSEKSYNWITDYIQSNLENWKDDRFYKNLV